MTLNEARKNIGKTVIWTVMGTEGIIVYVSGSKVYVSFSGPIEKLDPAELTLKEVS